MNKILCKDIDGNQYSTVTIRNKIWMIDNLKVTHYTDNTNISILEDLKEWYDDIKGAMCYYHNDKNKGALYNFYSVDTQKLAPKGWHIPTDKEWEELNKVVEGFNPKLDGYRNYFGKGFYLLGKQGNWWSSTPYSSSRAYYRYLNSTGIGTPLGRSNGDSSFGFSVRCVKDINLIDYNIIDEKVKSNNNIDILNAITLLKANGYKIVKPYSKFEEV